MRLAALFLSSAGATARCAGQGTANGKPAKSGDRHTSRTKNDGWIGADIAYSRTAGRRRWRRPSGALTKTSARRGCPSDACRAACIAFWTQAPRGCYGTLGRAIAKHGAHRVLLCASPGSRAEHGAMGRRRALRGLHCGCGKEEGGKTLRAPGRRRRPRALQRLRRRR